MKLLLMTPLLFSLGLMAQTPKASYEVNDGTTPPGTFTSKSNKAKTYNKKTTTTTTTKKTRTTEASPVTSETGIINSSGVTTEEVNPSPNPTPQTDRELLRDTTLFGKKIGPQEREGTFDPGEPVELKEAQEEGPLDYSTTPEKRPTKPSESKEK